MLFIFFHLFFIVSSLLPYNSKKMNSLNYYAMVSTVYFQKASKSTKFNRIQININRCNRQLLQKIINGNQTQYVKIKSFNFDNLSLTKFIYILQNSGFINSINKYTILYTKYKQDIFNIDIYPVINQINITEYKKLRISAKFLQKLLRYQLGKPKNYLLIDSILHKVYSWYLLHGYKWISINIKSTSYINKINLTINEGEIHSVYIECKNKQVKKKTYFINSIILW
uniref:hypothetical protein n=1 Tax=Gracilaria cliftonii TaxID=206548 RepID=UPI001D124C0E|nr:hypothetical protein LKZ11_pgp125 [Gracilaria cliftonii]UAD84558.1 hypothetical protein [Gracilaria cliftonii]